MPVVLIGGIAALASLLAPGPEGPRATPASSGREASLAGFVNEDDARPVPDCDVQARVHDPRALPDDPPSRVFSARTDARGFFRLAGLAEGVYAVRATARGRSSATELRSLRPGREERLASALVVRPPQPLELRFDPPRDPRGRPWLLSVRGSLDMANPPALQAPVEEGRWTHPGLVLDTYEVAIGDARGNTWRKLKVPVSGPTTLDVDLGSVAISGRVRLGEQPLPARLLFVAGGELLTLETDAHGNYRGFLPDWDWRGSSASWSVTVRAPHVARSLLVRMDWPPAGREAAYDVALPPTSLSGIVVDEGGRPPDKDTWLVFPDQGEWRRFSEPREAPPRLPLEPAGPDGAPGEFLVRGLPPETLTLMAEGPGRASQRVACGFSAKGEGRAAPLVLRRVVRARIRLLDAKGALDWAHALAIPIGTRVGDPVEEAVDDEATLELVLPGDTEQLALALADRAGALHLVRLAVRDRERAALRLPEGTARLALSQHRPGAAGRLFLFHDGGLIDLESLRRLGVSSSLDAHGALAIAVPPGRYALCALSTELARRAILAAAAPAGCAEGSVAEGGELTLSLATRR